MVSQRTLKRRLRHALIEDAAFSDVTTGKIPSVQRHRVKAQILAKSGGVFCGAFLLAPLFEMLDPRIQVKKVTEDGSKIQKGKVVAMVAGRAAAVLAGERTYLNLASRLSGIATLTRQFVAATRGTQVKIFDTRKTIPLWRDLEKFAVKCGGGENHRFSLKEAVLIKDNHLKLLNRQGLSPVRIFGRDRFSSGKGRIQYYEMEANNLREVWAALKARVDIILLDNMERRFMEKAIKLIYATREALQSSYPLIEVSGGINLKNLKRLHGLGVDRVSIGALTHSAPVVDLSLEVC